MYGFPNLHVVHLCTSSSPVLHIIYFQIVSLCEQKDLILLQKALRFKCVTSIYVDLLLNRLMSVKIIRLVSLMGSFYNCWIDVTAGGGFLSDITRQLSPLLCWHGLSFVIFIDQLITKLSIVQNTKGFFLPQKKLPYLYLAESFVIVALKLRTFSFCLFERHGWILCRWNWITFRTFM